MQDSAGPFSSSLDGHEAIVPLRKGFRFPHEPVRPEGSEAAFVGRDQDLEELAARLLFSNGGAFLVTGYRGVGKTSFVNQVIRKLSDSMPWASEQFGQVRIIAISISIPRKIAPAELTYLPCMDQAVPEEPGTWPSHSGFDRDDRPSAVRL